jgi:hypothetical protein
MVHKEGVLVLLVTEGVHIIRGKSKFDDVNDDSCLQGGKVVRGGGCG